MLNPTALTDTELVGVIKSGAEPSTSLAISCLKSRHEKIFHSSFPIFSKSAFFQKEELLNQAEYIIYKTAMSFDGSRGVKFSTHLVNQIKWTCLSKNRSKFNAESPFDPKDVCSIIDASEIQEFQVEKADELSIIKKEISLFDDRTKSLFEMRYFSNNKKKLTPWREIAQKLGCSIEWCRVLHDKTLSQLRSGLSKTYGFETI